MGDTVCGGLYIVGSRCPLCGFDRSIDWLGYQSRGAARDKWRITGCNAVVVALRNHAIQYTIK